MFALIAFIVVFAAGVVCGARWIAPWIKWQWPKLGKALFGSLAAVLLGCAMPSPADCQTVDTTGWTHTDSTQVTDTLGWRATDSVAIAWRVTDSAPTLGTPHWCYTDSTPVTDTIPAPPVDSSPAPPPTAGGPPPGFAVLASVPCNVVGESGFRLTTNPALFAIAKDPVRGSVCQTTYPAGWDDGTSPVTYTLALPKLARDLYVAYWAKTSANWVGHSVGIKQLIVHTASGTNAFPRLVAMKGLAGFTVENPGFPKGLTNQPLPALAVPITRDIWHRYEFIVSRTGHVTFWVDGQLTTNATAAAFGSAVWTEVLWRPIYGGNNGSKLPARQYEWFDDLIVATGP